MSYKYKFHNPEELYFVTFATEGWTDVFTPQRIQEYIDRQPDVLPKEQKA